MKLNARMSGWHTNKTHDVTSTKDIKVEYVLEEDALCFYIEDLNGKSMLIEFNTDLTRDIATHLNIYLSEV